MLYVNLYGQFCYVPRDAGPEGIDVQLIATNKTAEEAADSACALHVCLWRLICR